MKPMIKIGLTLLAAAAAGAAFAQPPGAADPLRDPNTMTVSLADLDFRSPQGVRVAYQRLHSAAKMACDSGSRDLRVVSADAACARQALDQAVRSVDRPLLTALHGGPAAIQLASRADQF